MSFLRQLTKRLLTTCVSPRWLLTSGPRHAAGERPRLALTFDDGPNPQHTGRLLDVLRDARLTATFFVVGNAAQQHPDLIRRMVNEGHEIGNHTWSHSDPARTSSHEFLDEVQRTNQLLQELTCSSPRSMRPPKGELNWKKLSGLWKQGTTVALWNVDPRDYRMQTANEMSLWSARYAPQDGDVLLFHDNHPWAAGAIQSFLDRGLFDRFQTVTVSEMAGNSVCSAIAEHPLQVTAAPSEIVTYS